jgi:hypothetical protein
MSLRRSLIASSLILAPITTFGFGSAAFADTATDNIQLSGTVSSIIAIQADPTPDAANLPVATGGIQSTKIADISITTNNTAGVTITASSTNEGNLLSSTNPNDTIPYQVAVVANGASPNFVSIDALNQSETTGFDANSGQKTVELMIELNNPALPKRGNYNDTITLIVADN